MGALGLALVLVGCGEASTVTPQPMGGAEGGPAAVCGDGVVGGDEDCDLGPVDGSACNGPEAGDLACTAAACGDGYVNATAGEDCEESADTAECNGVGAGLQGCHAAACGDGYLNAVAGETCDDGNTVAGDGCSGRCLAVEGVPDLVVAPAVVDFGIVRTANPIEESLSLSNIGDAPVEIFGVTMTGAPTFVLRVGEREVGDYPKGVYLPS